MNLNENMTNDPKISPRFVEKVDFENWKDDGFEEWRLSNDCDDLDNPNIINLNQGNYLNSIIT
jgi:hypothetical protein